jgi:hypothetical protein
MAHPRDNTDPDLTSTWTTVSFPVTVLAEDIPYLTISFGYLVHLEHLECVLSHSAAGMITPDFTCRCKTTIVLRDYGLS